LRVVFRSGWVGESEKKQHDGENKIATRRGRTPL
jgi:hypothetical protein